MVCHTSYEAIQTPVLRRFWVYYSDSLPHCNTHIHIHQCYFSKEFMQVKLVFKVRNNFDFTYSSLKDWHVHVHAQVHKHVQACTHVHMNTHMYNHTHMHTGWILSTV